MKTKFFFVPDQAKATMRQTARDHLEGLQTVIETSDRLPHVLTWTPPAGDQRGYISQIFSLSEELRYYLSPGHQADSYFADKIEFVYTDMSREDVVTRELARVHFDVTREQWARDSYESIVGKVSYMVRDKQTAN